MHLTFRARPSLQAFYLRTTFPSAELSDDAKTLKDAGLLNAAVLLRIK
jgi:UBX domain